MFLQNTKKVIKTFGEEKYQYVLYLSDKSECNAITNGKLDMSQYNVVAYGDCTTMDIKTALGVLPSPKFLHNLITGKMEDTYHCFCCEKLGVDQFIGHRTPLNSWDCLMASLGNPSHCVILQESTSNG